jgi:hypothetical protein
LLPKPRDWHGKEWQGRKSGTYKWYEIQDSIDYFHEFEKPKIIWGNLATNPKFYLDDEGFYINAPGAITSCDDLYYLLGILNSKICNFVISKIAAGRQGGFFEYKPVYVSQIPIHIINRKNQDEVELHGQIISLVKGMLTLHKKTARYPQENDALQRQIAATDKQIDNLVYQLYGLTPEEIKIVEES